MKIIIIINFAKIIHSNQPLKIFSQENHCLKTKLLDMTIKK